ncbi:SMAD/FHA domain-containing protein [Coniochaeta hoffmannii]|uniref:SMAD/FHA domain-containing protein n=1 Tax=Coniochaeta hoffmannii TaxID=91930 RepID=A0AA38S1X9_9PEZI|nr:SMAD/FHA domain-containing protein [Coniochaeta hoffmannii]
MGSDISDSGYRSRRRKHGDDDEASSSRKRRQRDDEDVERPRRRDRSRSTSLRREKRDRSRSPDSARRGSRERKRDRDGSDSHRTGHRDSPPKPSVRRSAPLPSQDADFAVSSGLEPVPEKEKPNFAPTGALAAAANAVTTSTGETVTLKYHEPPEARKPPPRDKWKMFVFKGKDVIDTIELSLRSCWLVGRDRAVVDLPAEHPSVSKQHAVLQFRYVERRNEFGDRVGKVKPYLIDLESANGTVLNGDKVPESRYLEVRNQDVIKFGLSEREYVVMLDRE